MDGLTSLAAHAVDEPDLLPPEQAFPLTVSLSGPKQVTLDFNTRPGYYLYRDRFSSMVEGAPIKPDQMPPGELKNGPIFGMVTVYHRPVKLIQKKTDIYPLEKKVPIMGKHRIPYPAEFRAQMVELVKAGRRPE